MKTPSSDMILAYAGATLIEWAVKRKARCGGA